MRARLVAALICALALAGFTAPVAYAGLSANSPSSKSHIWARKCLDFSDPKCAATKVKPGKSIPSGKRYLMVGYGWKACAMPNRTRCFGGSSYTKVGVVPTTWYVD